MGQTTTQTAAQIAQSGAATTAGIITALTAASTAGMATGIGAAVAGAAVLAQAIYNLFKGCGQTCVITSDIANQVETLLKQNLQTYVSTPVRYASFQQACLNNFQTAWNSLTAQCGNPSYAQAGIACVSDREQGSCKWMTQTPGGWQNGVWVPPGPQVTSGGSCWNWWIGYHDPIANDPDVQPDPTSAGSAGSLSIPGLPSLPSGTSGDLILALALLAAAFIL